MIVRKFNVNYPVEIFCVDNKYCAPSCFWGRYSTCMLTRRERKIDYNAHALGVGAYVCHCLQPVNKPCELLQVVVTADRIGWDNVTKALRLRWRRMYGRPINDRGIPVKFLRDDAAILKEQTRKSGDNSLAKCRLREAVLDLHAAEFALDIMHNRHRSKCPRLSQMQIHRYHDHLSAAKHDNYLSRVAAYLNDLCTLLRVQPLFSVSDIRDWYHGIGPKTPALLRSIQCTTRESP